jgi:HSP20 family molecular chaperone IbpA
MTRLARRTGSPMADIWGWLDSEPWTPFKTLGLAPTIRVEDFVEDGTYVLRAEMPGIDPDKDVELTVDHEMLTIKGTREEQVHEKHLSEFHYGSFSRMVPLPHGVKPEQVTATYSDGVLEVRIPQIEEPEEHSKIPVMRKDADDKT